MNYLTIVSSLTSQLFGRTLVCSVLLLCASSAGAEDSPKPKAEILEKVFDFGTVTQGSKVSHDFTIRNLGTADLVVQRLVPACGCTAASSSPDPIKPGAESKIKVDFDTSGLAGEKLKTVRVFTNDFDNLNVVLSLKGSIEPDITVEPQSVFFEEVIRGTPADKNTRVIEVRTRKGSNAKILGVSSFSRYLVVKDLPGTEEAKRFSVAINPEVPLGELRDRVVIAVAGGKESTINVPVYAAVGQPLVLKPPQVSFGLIEGTEPISRAVHFENRGPIPVRVTGVHSESALVEPTLKEIESGKNYVLQIRIDPKKISSDLRTTIRVKTDSELQPELALDVFGVLPPTAAK